MIQIRRSADRGVTQLGWLDSRHTFSFADYYDPGHMSFGALRVINEDRVAPGAGFGTHDCGDMEIISYVLQGALEHNDSIGTRSVIRPGDVQVMSAGRGILHSEFNHSTVEPLHFLQVWLEPNRNQVAPRYEQKAFEEGSKRGPLTLIASPDGRDGSASIYQDAQLWTGLLDAGQRQEHVLGGKRKGWVQVASGALRVNRHDLVAGDGAALEAEADLTLEARSDRTRILLFDLP